MALIKTPRAVIDVLDATGAITGHEIEYFYTWEGEGAEFFTAKVGREEASLEQVEVYRKHSNDALTASFQALNVQLAQEREQAASDKAALAQAAASEKAELLAEAARVAAKSEA